MASPVEAAAMRRAIALSAHGLGTTSPNPPVGCIILDSAERVVGEGYHQRKGEPHAEWHALAAAGPRARGGTAVVTLEPCNHDGRTPACHQALIDAGISRVLIAIFDPTSRGEGGVSRLRQAGVDVEVNVLSDDAQLVLGPWLTALQTGRPQVTWPYAVTPAGLLEPLSALSDAQALRRSVDAVLSEDGSVDEAVPGSHGDGALALADGPVSGGPQAVLHATYKSGVRTLLLDGGSQLSTPFLAQRLIDRVVVYVAAAEPSVQPMSDPRSMPFVPTGFRLVDVARRERHVRVEAIVDG